MEGYAVTAQYYDLFASVAHTDTDRRIASALEGLDTAAGPVIDIGAGTGLTTALIARTLADAEVLAIEPDAAMRPALMARVWADWDLRRRVTILPFGVLSASLPEKIACAVLSASLVHFSPQERRLLWALLSQRLGANGRVVVEVQCPQATDIAGTEMQPATVGRITYHGTATAERIDNDRQRWRMIYRAMLDHCEIARDEAVYECWAVSAETVIEEAAMAGFVGTALDDLVILNRAATS
jgi:trans-aconitate methyltransferase